MLKIEQVITQYVILSIIPIVTVSVMGDYLFDRPSLYIGWFINFIVFVVVRFKFVDK